MAETQAAAGTAAAETGKPGSAPAEPPTTHESKDSPGAGGGGATAPAAAGTGAAASGGSPGGGSAGGSAAGSSAAGGSGSGGGASSGGSADAAGRSVVGRASVPLEKPGSGPTPTQAKVIAKYTRAPGMVPPPETPTPGASGAGPGTVSSGATTPQPVAGARPPQPSPIATVSTPTPASPAVARVTVRPSGGTGAVQTAARPAGNTTSTNLGTATQAVVTAPVSTGAPSGSATAGAAAAGAVATAGAARVTEAVRAARATVSAAAGRSPRRARLNLKRIDPWSVMKFSFAVSFVLFVVIIVATSVLYLALDAMGVFESVNKALAEMVGATGGDGSGIKITAKGVIGGAGLIGLVNVVLFTALATLSAFVYNVCADLVGGLELTLAERE